MGFRVRVARKVSQWHILNKVSREWAPAVLVALVILVVQVDPEVPVVLRGAALECSQCAGPVTRLAGRLRKPLKLAMAKKPVTPVLSRETFGR